MLPSGTLLKSDLAKTLPSFSKRPKIPTATPAELLSSTAATTSLITVPRYCSLCRATITEKSLYRSCIKCRTKDQEKRKRRKERQRAQINMKLKELLLDAKHSADEAGVEPPKKKHKTEKAHTSKAHKDRHVPVLAAGHGPNVPIGEKVAAYVKARRAKEVSISSLRNHKTREAESLFVGIPSACLEFQTSVELHDTLSSMVREYYGRSLSRSSASSFIVFQGCYSVVADPSISHSRRVELESSLVQKIDKLPHGKGQHVSDSTQNGYHKRTFPCNCSEGLPRSSHTTSVVAPVISAAVPTPSSSPSGSSTPIAGKSSLKAPLKRQQSDLSKWIVRQGAKGACLATPKHVTVRGPPGAGLIKPVPVPVSVTPQSTASPLSCGGKVSIVAMDDSSHMLGALCKGQKIVITIEHSVKRR